MTEKQTKTQPNIAIKDQTYTILLAKTLWSGRKTLWISLFVGAVMGIFFALFSTNEYTASTVMIPQMGSKGQFQLGGLAALAGLDITGMNQTNELSPILYPKIINSTPFKLELMYTPIKFSKFEKPISLFDYYTKYKKLSVVEVMKKYTFGFPSLIIKALKNKPEEINLPKDSSNQPILLSEDQYIVCNILEEVISLEVDKKDGFLILIVRMPEALAAAQVAKKSQQLLQRDITNFKVEKAKADLDFIQERYNEIKSQAEGYQVDIAQKTDQFKSLTSNLPQVQTARIQTKYGITNSIFQELAKQLEQAKIQVKKDTPTFTIIEPVSVPNEKSKPNRPLILIICIFLCTIVGVSIILGKQYLEVIKQNWRDS